MISRFRSLARPADLALLLILAAGTGLRFFRLDHSLRVDEAETWMYAQWPLTNYLLERIMVVHLKFLTWMTIWLLGDGEFFLRVPHAVYGIMALFFAFLTGRKLFDEATGLLSCLLLAFSVYHVRFSQEARYYAPLAAYALCELYFLLMTFDASSVRKRFVYAGLLAASMLLSIIVHPFAFYPLVLVAILAVYWGWARYGTGIVGDALSSPKYMLPMAVCAALLMAVSVVLYHPLLYTLWDFVEREIAGNMTLRQSYLSWHYRPGGSILVDFAREFGGGKTAAWLFPVLCATAVWRRWRERAREIVVLGLWIGLPLLSTAVVRSHVHFELRYFIFLLPVYLIWVSAGIAGAIEIPSSLTGNARAIWKPAAALFLLTAIFHENVRELSAYYAAPKSRLREAVRHIHDNCSAGDAVLPYPSWDIYWYRYYPLPAGCRVYPTKALIPAEGERAPLALMRGSRRIWLAATWIKDPVRAEEFERLRRLVERYYVLEETTRFRSGNENDDFHVYRYRKVSSSPPPPRAGEPIARKDASSCLHLRSVTLMGNVEDSIQALPAGKTKVIWSLSPDIEASLFRPLASLAARSTRSGRERIYFVWSGRVTWRNGDKAETYVRGDVLAVPAGIGGTWSSHSRGAVIEIPVSTGRNPLASGGGGHEAPVRLPNAWSSIERLRAGEAGEIVLARKDGLVVSVRRAPPGAANTDMGHGGRGTSLAFSLVLGGRVTVEWSGFDERISFFPGDLYKTRLLPAPIPNEYGDGLRFTNPGEGELVELRVLTREIPWTEGLRSTSLEDEKLEAGYCLRGGIL